MKIELTRTEAMVLAGEMEHAPTCDALNPTSWYEDDDGATWTDSTCTVPYTPTRTVSCECGYFDLLVRAEGRVAAALRAEEVDAE